MNIFSTHNDSSEYQGQTYTPYSRRHLPQNQTPGASHDEVLISEAAKKAYQADGNEGVYFPNFSRASNPKIPVALPDWLELIRRSFQRRLFSLLESRHVAITEGGALWLKRNLEGEIRVAKSHPDQEAVESVFLENALLVREWNTLVRLSGLLQNLSDLRPFFSRYQDDALHALEAFDSLFPPSWNDEPLMRVEGDAVHVIFPERVPQGLS